MRFAASVLALLIALFAAVPTAAAAPRADPKVVLIVGPAGSATDRYRERAEAAARVADRYTSNVVRLYSPNATWPAVKQALQGAAVVVYLGHGNGWPSRYRDTPYAATQNGFGLNPVAGGDDYTHQYFGEEFLASQVRLADNAIVLLHHLCYASGNTEPGLAEGTIDQARQRVANYAAGFIAAGAGAVVAEGHMGPAWYMNRLLNGKGSIDRIWRASPNVHGHEFRFESPRSPGFTVAMDPDRPDRGFYRSIVYRGGVGAGRLEATTAAALPLEPPEPSLVGAGLEVGTPYFKEPPVAGSDIRLRFRYGAQDGDALEGLTVGVRWDPIDVAEGSAPEEAADPDAAADGPGADDAPEAEPGTEPDEPTAAEAGAPDPAEAETTGDAAAEDAPGDSAAEPATEAEPGASDAAGEPGPRVDARIPAYELAPPDPGPAAPEPPAPGEPDPSTVPLSYIQPERVGDVVEPGAAVVRRDKVGIDMTMPSAPGRYRLVLTLHDKDGVAYDAATQALVSGLIVDVTPPIAARYLVTASAKAAPGRTLELPVGVANVGGEAWGQAGTQIPRRTSMVERPIYGTLVAHWVALDGGPVSTPAKAVKLAPGLEPGTVDRAVLRLDVPEAPGSYLVVLDVVLPEIGSLAAQGIDPALVRVTVE
jgi:hypothetical protein